MMFGQSPATSTGTLGEHPDAPVTQQAVAGREMNELMELVEEPSALLHATSEAIKAGTLETSASLQQISQMSSRLLQRNETRRTAVAFLETIRDKKTDAKVFTEAFQHMCSCIWMTYGKLQYNKEDQETGYLSKIFLHGLNGGGAPSTTLCMRFALSEHPGDAGDESQYDLSLTVLQVKPFVSNSAKFTFSFSVQDTFAADAADWGLDESQRSRLLELHSLLGLPAVYETASAMLGLLLATGGGSQLENDRFLVKALHGARAGHREEVLAKGGAFFG